MKTKYLKFINSFFFLFVLQLLSYAQLGPQFTQYIFNEAFINPAYVGSQDALAINASYRNQWVGIDGAPITQTLVAHSPLFHKKIGVGVTLYNEKVGVLKETSGYLNFSYRINMRTSTLSFGLSAGAESVREDFAKVKTTQPNDAQFMYNIPRTVSPNFGFGMYYYTQKWFTGISIPRFIKTSYGTDSNKIITRVDPKNFNYYGVIGYIIDQNANYIWKPYALVKLIQGAPVQANVALSVLMYKTLWLGASYRTDKTASIIVGFQITPQLNFTYSYDYTFSPIQKYNKGSHELHLSYLFSFNKEKVITPRLF